MITWTSTSLTICSPSVQGWEDDCLDAHFKAQRDSVDNPTESQKLCWFDAMKLVIGELDSSFGFVSKFLPIEFLDLG